MTNKMVQAASPPALAKSATTGHPQFRNGKEKRRKVAEVSGAVAHAAGFDLHAQQASAMFDADVVGEGVSPGFEDVVSARGGGRHEFEFDPFATLFESAELTGKLHSY